MRSGVTDKLDWLVINETQGTLGFRFNELEQ